MSSNFKSDFFAVADSNDEFDIVLNPPASDESIQELSNALGFSLPPTLIELLRLADGEADGSGGRASAFKLLEQLLQLNIACQKSVGPNFQLSS